MHTEVQRSRMNAIGSATVMVGRVLLLSMRLYLVANPCIAAWTEVRAWHVTDGNCKLGLLQEQEEDMDAMLKEWER